MDVKINGETYVKYRDHKIGLFDGEELYYGDILYDSKKGHYNIAVSHVNFKFSGIYFVGQDQRTINVKNATRRGPHK